MFEHTGELEYLFGSYQFVSHKRNKVLLYMLFYNNKNVLSTLFTSLNYDLLYFLFS